MTIRLNEHKQSRSMPWENYLYPKLREPEHAIGYLEACLQEQQDETCPSLLGDAIVSVIQANKDLPFIAYPIIYHYS